MIQKVYVLEVAQRSSMYNKPESKKKTKYYYFQSHISLFVFHLIPFVMWGVKFTS